MAYRTLTDNCAVTFSESGDSRVDFFFHITEDAQKEKTIELLAKSWNTNALDSLKLVAFLRDCRNGKGIRRQYHMCLLWLFDNHFETLIHNVQHLVEYGYWKDLLHLLIILLYNGLIPEYMASDDGVKSSNAVVRASKSGRKGHQAVRSLPTYDVIVLKADKDETKKRIRIINDKKKSLKSKRKATEEIKDIEMAEATDEESLEAVQTVLTREETLQYIRHKYNNKRYKSDEKYRRLYDRVVELFANELKKDLEKMAKNDAISLAGKWAPTNGHHFDKYLDISGAIAKQLSKVMDKSEIMNDKKALANFYQRQVCAPLRAHLKIPEVFMSANQWDSLDYKRVASKCMQKNKLLFIKHDKQRFEKFLADNKTISGAVLKPVEMVERGDKLLFPGQNDDNIETEKNVLNKQWQSLVESVRKKGIN